MWANTVVEDQFERGFAESLVSGEDFIEEYDGFFRALVGRVYREKFGEIGRAHVELQSLMRTPYVVFCLKNKMTESSEENTSEAHYQMPIQNTVFWFNTQRIPL